jgi:hypothetical protein
MSSGAQSLFPALGTNWAVCADCGRAGRGPVNSRIVSNSSIIRPSPNRSSFGHL